MGISVNLLAAILATRVVPSGFLVDTTLLADITSTNRTTDTQFRLTLNPNLGGYNFRIEWGDGAIDHVTCDAGAAPVVVETVAAPPGTLTEAGTIIVNSRTTPSLLHTYAVPGQYALQISERTSYGFPAIAFNDPAGTSGGQPPLSKKSTDGLKLIEIQRWGSNTWQSMQGAFEGCVNLRFLATDSANARTGGTASWDRAFTQCRSMTSFPHMDFSGATDITSCWNGCVSLVDIDPTLDFSNVTKSVFTFVTCSSLLVLPAFDLSKSRDFQGCFQNMASLSAFPLMHFDEGLDFFNAFNNLPLAVTVFPACTFPKATRIQNAWIGSDIVTFLPTDFPEVTNADAAWQSCAKMVSCHVSLPKVTNLKDTFRGCTLLPENPLDDVQTATSMQDTFNGCVLFKHDVGSWWPKLVTTMSGLFSGVDLNDPSSPVNLTTNSTVFGSWTLTAATVTSNPVTRPDGSLSADLLKPSVTSTADHSASQNVTVVPGSEYTAYCCFKLDGYTFGRLVVSNAFAADIFVDLTTGAVISSSGTATVTPLADGWYKLAVTGIAATATLNIKCQAFSTGVVAAFAGNATLGIYLWGGKVFLSTGGVVSNYDALLTGWTGWFAGAPSPVKTLQSNVSFNAGNSKYSLIGDAADARRYLVTVLGWTITDGGPY